MSVQFGRVTIADPLAWDEPVGDKVDRVGGIPVPSARAGVRVDADLVAGAAPGQGTAAQRLTVRRQLRSLLNNPLARFQGVWVAWDGDDEQSGWYVPGEGTMAVEVGQFPQSFYRATGLALELVGRPRTHRRAVLVRVRDLRLATEPKDTLRRLYGACFDGGGSRGSNVTPAPLVYLPSTATDVVVHGAGSATLGTARTGRSSTSVNPVTGVTDLAVVSMEQAEASRLLGDVVVYDRRTDVAAVTTTGPTAGWEEVYGPDWPWTGLAVIDNYVARTYLTTGETFAMEYWDGAAYTEFGAVTIKARISSTDYTLDTVLATTVHEWTPDRAVVKFTMHRAAQTGTRCDVFVTMQRGWRGPRIEVYPSTSGQTVKISIDPTGTLNSTTLPASFTAAVNYGSITATSHGLAVAVVQHAATTATVGGAREIAGAGYVSAHIERCATADVATASAALGADVLAGTTYPQTIVTR